MAKNPCALGAGLNCNIVNKKSGDTKHHKIGETLCVLDTEIVNFKDFFTHFVDHLFFGHFFIEFILQVTDNGEPALTRYQRVIITIIP